jgi:hypothetical protein
MERIYSYSGTSSYINAQQARSNLFLNCKVFFPSLCRHLEEKLKIYPSFTLITDRQPLFLLFLEYSIQQWQNEYFTRVETKGKYHEYNVYVN